LDDDARAKRNDKVPKDFDNKWTAIMEEMENYKAKVI
jgi:hypothetical protein